MASITGTLVDNSGQERVAGTFTFSGTSTMGDITVTSVTTTGAVNIGGALNHDGTTVGFYGTTPIALQTGVAVSSAGIHAALVALGLITA